MSRSLAAGRAAHLACLWEASAHKPGNVHPEASFSDVCYDDYVASAAAIAPVMEQAASQPLGTTILAAVQATQRAVGRGPKSRRVVAPVESRLAFVEHHRNVGAEILLDLEQLFAVSVLDVEEYAAQVQPEVIGLLLEVHRLRSVEALDIGVDSPG